jgi:ubiquinone/menaquinone biosynthesis C-methylase UbiE
MKEYYGKSAKKYGQTRGKSLLLLPALKRNLPKATDSKARALDVACGNGDIFPIVKAKGYKYFGLDISQDLLKRAEVDFPSGKYQKGDARNLKKYYKTRFNAIIISMLFPAFDRKQDIVKVLKASKKLVAKKGVILIAVTHPAFDHYMQSFLFKRQDVHTDFKGYFHSGTYFRMDQQINGDPFTFEDYHWTLTDYFDAVKASGLVIVNMDECRGESKVLSKDDREYARKRDNIPTYLVLTLKTS